MNNRISTSPIFFALTLALAGGFVGLSQADPAPAVAAPTTPPSAAAAPAAPADATAPAPGERPATYTVVAGDSYWTIAQKFGVSTKKLKKLNNAKSNALKPGQVLQIPPAKTEAAAPAAKPTADVTPAKPKKAKSIAATSSTQPAAVLLPDTAVPASETIVSDTPIKPKKAKTLAAADAGSSTSAPVADISAPAIKSTAVTTPVKPKKAKSIGTATTTDKMADPAVATDTASGFKTSRHHSKIPLLAQPVQGFDVVAASTFASCPVVPSNADDASTAPVATPAAIEPMATQAPVAQLATPEEVTEEAPKPEPPVARTVPPAPKAIASEIPSSSIFAAHPQSSFNSPSSKYSGRQSSSLSFTTPSETSDWGNRFLTEARALGDRGIEYDEAWRPPGESHSWDMDCSNTSRYLYKVTTGISLPRTASDQYYYLHLQNKAWDVPQTSTGFADCNYLRHNLKAGDLLFWENTYRPERQPPITHVMVFLGTNNKGEWIMAGSQTSRGGEHNRRNGGPDIYVFDPTKPCGGYSTWLGLVRHQGRFCAYGRPLEADKSKLDVAANN